MVLQVETSTRWGSECGRYQVTRRSLTPRDVVLTARFYGHVIYQEGGHIVENHLESVRQYCEMHRARLLPRIIEFENWIQQRYGAKLNHPPLGPLARRDRVKELILARGEWTMPIRDSTQGTSSTLGEIFAALYESATDERHENGDGV